MLIVTIFALFGDDFRQAATPKSADDGFAIAMIICLSLFSIEITTSCIAKSDYLWSFFFYLDILATVTLIFDIDWIWNLIYQDSGSSFVQSAQLARTARASRAGTRAARIIRIIRVIRLIRIFKLYKIAQAKLIKKEGILLRGSISCRDNPEIGPLKLLSKPPEHVEVIEDSISQNFDSYRDYEPNKDEEEILSVNRKLTTMKRSITLGETKPELPEESKVGKKLSELTTMRTVTVVLIMIIALPFFDLNFYNNIDEYQLGLEMIDYFRTNEYDFNYTFYEYISKYSGSDTPIIYLSILNTDYLWNSSNPDDYRNVEIEIITLDVSSNYTYYSVSIFSLKSQVDLQAGINMLKTFFICIVLTVGSIMFSKDTNKIVLEPLENMIITVKNIAKNPLLAVQEEEKHSVMKEQAFETTMIKEKVPHRLLETEILEQLIIKIGALMALGFGEAGSAIIAKNMEQSKGDVDPMIPGKRQICIFGFTDIRQFSDVTEALEQDTMIFVNEIAFIVHKFVDECLGTTNKNLGDVFVLVWKFPDSVITKDRNKKKTLISHPFIAQFADLTVISFMKIISDISRNQTILKYNENTLILSKIPNFKVKMGFGLHFGWGIEGAIGSEYKIDASYLSPNVNLASRLCAATKQYGVWILISEQVHNLLSEKMKKYMRRLDRVTFKGSAEPMNIYTIDLQTNNLTLYYPKNLGFQKNKKRARVSQRMNKEELRTDLWSGAYKAVRKLKEDSDLKEILLAVNPEFVEIFEKGIKNYLDGNWKIAKECFVKALTFKENDGPCINLIHFIEEYGNNAPDNWPGYRKLMEK
jgi:class 3 adenylate cyclase